MGEKPAPAEYDLSIRCGNLIPLARHFGVNEIGSLAGPLGSQRIVGVGIGPEPTLLQGLRKSFLPPNWHR